MSSAPRIVALALIATLAAFATACSDSASSADAATPDSRTDGAVGDVTPLPDASGTRDRGSGDGLVVDGPRADGPAGEGPRADGPRADTIARRDTLSPDTAPAPPKTIRLTEIGGVGNDYVSCFAANKAGVAVMASSFRAALTVAGKTLTPVGSGGDVYVVRVDATGKVSWVTQVSGAGGERVNACAVDAAGDVYIGGRHDGGLSLGGKTITSHGSLDGFAAKLSGSNGGLAWLKDLGESKSDDVGGLAIDSSGDVIVSGVIRTQIVVDGKTVAATAGNVYVLRLTAATGAYKAHGNLGKGFVQPLHVSTGAGGAIVVGGFFGGTATFGSSTPTAAGTYDLFVAKLDSALALAWHAIGTGAGTESRIVTAVSSSGRVVACGAFTQTFAWGTKSVKQGPALNEAFYVGFDGSSGAPSWALQIAGKGNSYNTCADLAPTASGDRVVGAGWFTGSPTLFGTSSLDEGAGSYIASINAATGAFVWAFNNRSGSTASNAINGLGLLSNGRAVVGGAFEKTLMVGGQSINASAAEAVQMYVLETELPKP